MVTNMREKENVLILFGADSSLEWGRSFQIAKAFKSLGHDVLYVDIPLSAKNSFGAVNSINNADFQIYSPKFGLPCAKVPSLRALNYQIVYRQLVSCLEKAKFEPTIIWAYAPYEPKIAKSLKDRYESKLLVHDIADERISLAESLQGKKAAEVTKRYEEEMASYSDCLVVITERLKNAKKHLHNDIVVLSNGVDTDAFSPLNNLPAPDYFSNIPGDKVLYIGALEDWVDIEAIRKAAIDSPTVSFVLVGPVKTDISKLESLKNIHNLGRKPYSDMPSCIYHSNVCIMPFKDNEITRNSDPLKVLQYLAMGKPVVSLHYKGVKDYDGALQIAFGHDEFSQYVVSSLKNNVICKISPVVETFSWKYLVNDFITSSRCNKNV